MLYRDRTEAGRKLATALERYAGRSDVIVLALPRGGVPVAYEVARSLAAPLDVFVVRKLGMPHHEELAMGAIASGGTRFLDQHVIEMFGVTAAEVDRITEHEMRELQRRERQYRGDTPFPDLTGRIAILVDDGLATGSSMRAAITALRQQGPRHVVVAVPVGAPDTCDSLRPLADEVVCAATPWPFNAVGQWYADFSQTSDEEVRELLGRGTRGPAQPRRRNAAVRR